MGSSFVRPSLIYSLLLLFLSFPLISFATKVVSVQEICSKHRNPSFCSTVLNSKPGGAAGVDLATLGQYTINLAHKNGFDTITLIHNLIGKTTEPQLKQRYISCSMDYNDVLLSLNQATQSLSSGDYNGLNSAVATIKKDIEDCDSKPPSSDPSSLPKNNKDMEDTSLIIEIIANFLVQKS